MKIFEIALIAIVALVLAGIALVAIIYAVINHQGAQDWAAAQRELKAKGETMEWSAFVPASVKDEENLAFVPFFVRELSYTNDPKTGFYGFGPANSRPTDLKDLPFGAGGRPEGLRAAGWNLARPTDLETYAKVYDQAHNLPYPQPGDPAAGARGDLSFSEPILEEIAKAAAERPSTRFPVDWNTPNVFATALPHYNLQQQLVSALRLRASTELAASHSDEAGRDVDLAFRLCRDLCDEPNLIAHLVEITTLSNILTPIWEGLADRRWSADDLTRLQTELQGFDLLADYQHAIRGERAWGAVRGLDYFRNHFSELPALAHGTAPAPAAEQVLYKRMGMLIPRGCFDSSKATSIRLMQEYFVEGVDPRAHRAFPAKSEAGTAAVSRLSQTPTNLLPRLSVPIFASVLAKTTRLQAGLDEAIVACALERFALDHASQATRYPEALSELSPAYVDHLPTDVISGEAIRYGKTPDGRYRLYEVGWNGRDEGGKVVWRSGGDAPSQDNAQGDWVWQYTELPTPPGR